MVLSMCNAFVAPPRVQQKAPTSLSVVPPSWVGDLGFQLGQTVIAWSVPIVGGIFIVSSVSDNSDDGLRERRQELQLQFGLEDEDSGSRRKFGKFFGRSSSRKSLSNRPTAPSYLKIERLNDRLESFKFDLVAAADGNREARRMRRRSRLAAALEDELLSLSEDQLRQVAEAEAAYQLAVGEARNKAANAKAMLRALSVNPDADMMDEENEDDAVHDATKTNATLLELKTPKKKKQKKNFLKSMASVMKKKKDGDRKEYVNWLSEAAVEESEAEKNFLETIGDFTTDPESRRRITKLVFASATSSSDEPFLTKKTTTSHIKEEGKKKQRTYVLQFKGDVMASQTAQLRQEITAILEFARPGDEVLLRLETGGGTVTGYGAAAGQLLRLKRAGITLTVCVEEVAASGGYLMACAADHLVASPFAVLGSIGVITDIPNVYERLQREGIEYQTVTAGKYKRTLTPTKKPTRDDFVKTQKELEEVLSLFKSFVKENRPTLDIDTVATGETWYGDDAIAKGLIDEVITFDDLALQRFKQGIDVYSIKYQEPKLTPDDTILDLFKKLPGAQNIDAKALLARALTYVLQNYLVPDQGGEQQQYKNGRPTSFSSQGPPPLYMVDQDPPAYF